MAEGELLFEEARALMMDCQFGELPRLRSQTVISTASGHLSLRAAEIEESDVAGAVGAEVGMSPTLRQVPADRRTSAGRSQLPTYEQLIEVLRRQSV